MLVLISWIHNFTPPPRTSWHFSGVYEFPAVWWGLASTNLHLSDTVWDGRFARWLEDTILRPAKKYTYIYIYRCLRASNFLKWKASFHRHVTYFWGDINYPSGSSTCLSHRLKFPVFEIINMAMTFTAFSSGVSILVHQMEGVPRCLDDLQGFQGGDDLGWIEFTILWSPPEVDVLSFMKWSWTFAWGWVRLITIPEDDVSHQWNPGYSTSFVLLEFLSWPFPHDKLLGVMAAERAFREDFVFIHVQRLRVYHKTCSFLLAKKPVCCKPRACPSISKEADSSCKT